MTRSVQSACCTRPCNASVASRLCTSAVEMRPPSTLFCVSRAPATTAEPLPWLVQSARTTYASALPPIQTYRLRGLTNENTFCFLPLLYYYIIVFFFFFCRSHFFFWFDVQCIHSARLFAERVKREFNLACGRARSWGEGRTLGWPAVSMVVEAEKIGLCAVSGTLRGGGAARYQATVL